MRSPTKHPIAALSFGSSTFRLSVARRAKKQEHAPQLQHFTLPSKGVRNGVISNPELVKKTLEDLLAQAEETMGTTIEEASLRIPGSMCHGKTVTHTALLSDQIIHQKFLNSFDSKAKATFEAEGERIFFEPIFYQIDQRPKTQQPLGFSGKSMTATYFDLQTDHYYLKDLVRLCNDSGLRVNHVAPITLAVGTQAQLTGNHETGQSRAEDQIQVFIHIGADGAECMVTENNRAAKFTYIPIGSQHITRDLSIGLNISSEAAEQLKKSYSWQPSKYVCSERPVDFAQVDKIIRPRVREISFFIAKSLANYRGKLNGGLHVFGQGSELVGFHQHLEENLKIPVRPVENGPSGWEVVKEQIPMACQISYHIAQHVDSERENQGFWGSVKKIWREFS